MTALYNEIDRNAAAWLRQLIIAGLIAPGVVDERDIRDLEPEYVASFTQFHAFAGIGVWSHALRGAGWPDDRPIWTGSCPCQPFSAAGKGGGFDDERHLWPAFHHLIEECRPDLVLGEQVASKDGLAWLDLVYADLEGADYAVGAVDTCAAGFGAPHIRQRLYWSALAHPHHQGLEGRLAAAERTGERLAGPGRVAGGLAHTLDTLGRPDLPAGNDTAGPDAGRAEDSGDAGAGRGLCGLADANGGDAGAEREQCGGQQRQQPQNGGAGRVAQSLCDGAGLDTGTGVGAQAEADREDGGVSWERLRTWEQGSLFGLGPNRSDTNPAHPIAAPQPTTDGPDRLDDDNGDGAGRAQSSLSIGQQGADGSQLRPGPTNGFWGAPDWLHCRDGRWRPVEPGTFPLAHGAAARVGRLRGYGNAIVAPQAQAFVECVLEAVS